MSNLTATLRVAGSALDAYSHALGATQMNLTNMGVAGYARQTVGLASDRFDPAQGYYGGVLANGVQSTRQQFAEESVWLQQSKKAFHETVARGMGGVASLLGLANSGESGEIQSSLEALWNSFSGWQANPQSAQARSQVLGDARAVSAAISSVADYGQQLLGSMQSDAQVTVSDVNRLVSSVREWNVYVRNGGQTDAGAEARIYAGIEKLSGLIPVSTVKNDDGSFSLFLNGQQPLLSGDTQLEISAVPVAAPEDAAFPNANAGLRIQDAGGNDITASVTGGHLGGLVDSVNRLLPSVFGGPDEQGALNRLAQGVADSVNRVLNSGNPSAPVNLFDYSTTNPAAAARSLRVNSQVTDSSLAGLQADNPGLLAGLVQIRSGSGQQDQVNGQSYGTFFGAKTQDWAAEWSHQSDSAELHGQLFNQAVSIRDQVQGVSLEEEAVNLLQFQRSFEAMTRVIKVVDELIQTTLGLVS